MLNLDPKYLATLQHIFKKYVPDKIIWAYGSRIKGQSHEGSDLDLVIKDPNGLEISSRDMIALRETIQESNLPFLVDLLDWTMLPQDFQNEIEKAHEVLQEN